MQAAVRAWALGVTGEGMRSLREIPPPALLGLLCAAALSPILVAGAGLGAIAVAGSGVLSSVGGGVLSGIVTEALDRAKRKRASTSSQLEGEIADEISRMIDAQDAKARALRTEIAAVLEKIDAGGTVLRAAMEEASERVRGDVIAAMEVLSSSFGETRFLIEDVVLAAAEIQKGLDMQGADIRAIIEQNDRQSTDIRLVREEVAAIARRSRADGLTREPGDGDGPRWAGGCPYRGLLPFEETDAEVFYGRERLTAELAVKLGTRMSRGGLVVVTGASGAGKSSLLRAGLLPMLARGHQIDGSERWARVTMTPTKDPLTELASRLAALGGGAAEVIRNGLASHPEQAHMAMRAAVLAHAAHQSAASDGAERLVLIIDQFEQVFTLNPDPHGEAGRQAFITALSAAATCPVGPRQEPSALVVIAVRGDFWDRCAAYRELADALQDGQFVIRPMSEFDLRLAITGPAVAAGLLIEPTLTDTILSDLQVASGEEAGVLPLLSQAMALTWENRSGKQLTSRGYGLTGGVGRAVQNSADRVYGALPARQQVLARDLLRNMTVSSRDGTLTRRPVTRADLYGTQSDADRAQVGDVLEAFARERLIVINDDSVQIAHDALLRAWPRLRAWLEEDRATWILYGQLADDAAAWHDNSGDSSFLYRGTQLGAALVATTTWTANSARYPALTSVQTNFLQASKHAAARGARLRRIITVSLALLLVAALTGATLAIAAAVNATHQRNLAASAALATESEALDSADPVLAAQLAAAAWHIAPTAQVRDSMLDVLAQPERGILAGDPEALANASALAFSPDGKLLAAGIGDEALLWNAATRTQIGKPMRFGGPGNPVTALAFSPDGTILASDDGGAVFLWNVLHQTIVGTRLVDQGDPVASLAFSPDGKILATTTETGIQLWDVATHAEIGAGIGGGASAISFSPDGKTFVTAGSSIKRWDTATHNPVGSPLATGGWSTVSISPDGRFLAAGNNAGQVRLWNLATGDVIGAPLDTGTTRVQVIAFGPQDATLAAGNEAGAVTLWDTADQARVCSSLNAGILVSALAFNRTGTTLASASDTGAPILWDAKAWCQSGQPLSLGGQVYSAALSPDATKLAVVLNSTSSGVQLWDLSRRTAPRTFARGTDLTDSVAFSSDGKRLATVPVSGDQVQLWNAASLAATGAPMKTGVGQAVVFSPDGKTLATSGPPVRLWNIAAGTPTGRPINFGTPDYPVKAMAFSPDGKVFAAATQLGALRLWNAETHAPIGAAMTASGADEVAFSPDGTELATGNLDGTAQLWDVATRTPAGPPLNVDGVDQLAFSADGAFLATASNSGVVQLWDAATGVPVGAPLSTGTGDVFGLAFSSGGTLIAVTGTVVQRWDISLPSNLPANVCGIAGGSLTPQAWHYYIPSEPFQQICPAS